jgi:hypothetical protein
MARELLLNLIEVHALNPTPVGDQMVQAYVPFDTLLGGDQTETGLRNAMETGTRGSRSLVQADQENRASPNGSLELRAVRMPRRVCPYRSNATRQSRIPRPSRST